jgi:hypothetical protein
MSSPTRTATRALLGAMLVATLLVPGWLTPTRTVAVPSTMAAVATGGRAGTRSLSFPPTHLGFSWVGPAGGRILYRTKVAGGWSRWRPAPEAHDLAGGRRHYTGVLAVPRPDAVQWRARGPVADVTVDYLNTIDGPRRWVEVPAAASAAARAPGVVTRAEWGADESLTRKSGACRRAHHRTQQLFVHHTAGVNRDPHPAATMRAILYYHVVRRGWCDIGYNFVVSPRGRVFEGRFSRRFDPWELHDGEDRSSRIVTGAHVAEFNSGSVGVGMMGNFSTAPVPRRARRALVGLLAWEADRHNLPPRGRHVYRNPVTSVSRRLFVIAGHRDAGQTACPGGNLYRALPRIRRSVARVIGRGKANTRLVLGPRRLRVVFGGRPALSGTLRTRAGAPLAQRRVTLWTRPARRRWRRTETVTTGPRGAFSWSWNPRRNTRVAAAFAGGTRAWSDSSRRTRVLVAPRITLVPENAARDASGTFHLPAGSENVDLSGRLTPAHPRSPVTVRVTKQGTTASVVKKVRLDGASLLRARVPLPAPEPGAAYHARARWWGDLHHVPGASPLVRLAVDES